MNFRCDKVEMSGHAVRRMFERGISIDDVLAVLSNGERIASYPEDRPYPSHLVLGWRFGRPLHVVVAVDAVTNRCAVVTLYEPTSALWEPGFRARKQP